MKITLLIISLFAFATSKAQHVDALDVFSKQFKSDTLGEKHIRHKYLREDSNHVVYINNINLIGKREEWIIKYLGAPTSINNKLLIDKIFPSDEDVYDYRIDQEDSGSEELLIGIDKKNIIRSVVTIVVI